MPIDNKYLLNSNRSYNLKKTKQCAQIEKSINKDNSSINRMIEETKSGSQIIKGNTHQLLEENYETTDHRSATKTNENATYIKTNY